jgi:type III secretion protein C
VTPHIIRDKGETSIKLAVSVQDDQNDGSNSATTSSGVPPIKQTKINTQAIVNAGQSLLIGGYYYEQKGQDESGVPLLKSIPVVGNLFKATSKSTKRMERLILITPRIVKLGQANVPSQVDEPSFHRSPTQSDYEPRTPARKAGCSRRTSVENSFDAGREM